MASNIFDAFIKGPSEKSQAKQILMTAVVLVAFTIITTLGLFTYNIVSGVGGDLGGLLNDPTIPITLIVLGICAFFTYKGSVIAVSILLLNQLLDALVLVVSPESSISIITIVKIFIFISAIRAAWYLRQTNKKEMVQNA